MGLGGSTAGTAKRMSAMGVGELVFSMSGAKSIIIHTCCISDPSML